MASLIHVVTYDSRFDPAFAALNLEWIERHFRAEKKDLEQVRDPAACLRAGGQIFFALAGDEAVGTCALYPAGPGRYELAKMAVRPDFRGRGIGDRLMEAAEQWARFQHAEEILILSNTVLAPAIGLYRKHEYRVTHLGPHPDYERCNIEMRKGLTGP